MNFVKRVIACYYTEHRSYDSVVDSLEVSLWGVFEWLRLDSMFHLISLLVVSLLGKTHQT